MWASCNRNYDGSEGGRRREPQQRARTAVYGVTEPSEYVCGEMLKSSQLNAHHFDFDFEVLVTIKALVEQQVGDDGALARLDRADHEHAGRRLRQVRVQGFDLV